MTKTVTGTTAARTLAKEVQRAFPQVDAAIHEYVASYLGDTPANELVPLSSTTTMATTSSIGDDSGTSTWPLFEFLQPLVGGGSGSGGDADGDDEKLVTLCRNFQRQLLADRATSKQEAHANGNAHHDDDAEAQGAGGAQKLQAPIQINLTHAVSAAAEYTVPRMTTDITLTNVRTTLSLVDKKKLEKAEQRRARRLADQNARERVVEQWGGYEEMDDDVDEDDDMFQNTLMDPTLGKGKTKDVRLENFDINFGGKKILTNTNLTLAFGRRYGLIGRNGVGKSTLLRAIARRTVVGASKSGNGGGVPDHLRILHVAQEVHGDDTPVIKSVLQADAYRLSLLRREKEINGLLDEVHGGAKGEEGKVELTQTERDALANELKVLYSKLQYIEADKAESRASTILSGLGFSTEDQKAPTKSFSGGWRMRISLARALFCKPDILLLYEIDEPTNHCDINAVIWLEKYLQTWPNTLLVVSHDRDFLDEVATDVLHMHNERLDAYRGNYTMFLGTRAERRRNQLKEYEAQHQYRKHLQDFIDRWRFNAKRAAQAQSKIKILEKLPELVAPEDDGVEDGEARFRWPDPIDKLSPPILQATDVSFGYPVVDDSGKVVGSKAVLDAVSFSVQLGSRVAIVGANGAGKSTLLKLLIGELEPTRGIVQRHGRLRTAYFSQHHVDALETDGSRAQNSVEFLASKYPGRNEEDYRGVLGRFGISGNTAIQPIRTLSGGQKSRVVFAMMALTNPHILILDEVSNHLDIMTIDSLVQALNVKSGYQGGMVLVSHDARFIDAVCDEMWVCEKGKITKFVPTTLTLGGAGDDDDGEKHGMSGIADYKARILGQMQELKG